MDNSNTTHLIEVATTHAPKSANKGAPYGCTRERLDEAFEEIGPGYVLAMEDIHPYLHRVPTTTVLRELDARGLRLRGLSNQVDDLVGAVERYQERCDVDVRGLVSRANLSRGAVVAFLAGQSVHFRSTLKILEAAEVDTELVLEDRSRFDTRLSANDCATLDSIVGDLEEGACLEIVHNTGNMKLVWHCGANGQVRLTDWRKKAEEEKFTLENGCEFERHPERDRPWSMRWFHNNDDGWHLGGCFEGEWRRVSDIKSLMCSTPSYIDFIREEYPPRSPSSQQTKAVELDPQEEVSSFTDLREQFQGELDAVTAAFQMKQDAEAERTWIESPFLLSMPRDIFLCVVAKAPEICDTGVVRLLPTDISRESFRRMSVDVLHNLVTRYCEVHLDGDEPALFAVRSSLEFARSFAEPPEIPLMIEAALIVALESAARYCQILGDF